MGNWCGWHKPHPRQTQQYFFAFSLTSSLYFADLPLVCGRSAPQRVRLCALPLEGHDGEA